MTHARTIETFDLQPGRVIGGKYVVESKLGGGWEGEVYRVTEERTGARRAVKLFYPERNRGDRAVQVYARKLERLTHCPLVISYHHSETMRVRDMPITLLVSEYVEGKILENFIRSRSGRRLPELEALQILRHIVHGLTQIHSAGVYHGDLHTENVLVRRRGVHFDVKLVDFLDAGRHSRARANDDVIDAVRLLYDMLGGAARYRHQPPEIKYIVGGLKHSIITKRFPTAARLLDHLDTFPWA